MRRRGEERNGGEGDSAEVNHKTTHRGLGNRKINIYILENKYIHRQSELTNPTKIRPLPPG